MRLGGTPTPITLNLWIEQPVNVPPILSRVKPVIVTLVRHQEAIPRTAKFRGMAVYGLEPVAVYTEFK
jgi:hypothetical protein